MSWKVHGTDEVFAALRGLCSNSYRMYDPCEHRYYYDHDCDAYECVVEDVAEEYERLVEHCEKQREELAAIKNPLGKLKEAFMDNIDGSSKVRAGSSITDELRDWIDAASRNAIDAELILGNYRQLLAIADRIDAEHAVKVERLEKYRAAVDAMLKEYVKLPVDADGVPIRVGDTIEIEHNGRVTTVTSINYNEHGWQVYCAEGGGFDKDTRCRHVQPDSWERIIEDAVKLGYADYPTTSYEAELVERCKRLAGERG